MEKFIELFANLFDETDIIGRVEFAYRFIGHTDGR